MYKKGYFAVDHYHNPFSIQTWKFLKCIYSKCMLLLGKLIELLELGTPATVAAAAQLCEEYEKKKVSGFKFSKNEKKKKKKGRNRAGVKSAASNEVVVGEESSC